MRALRALCHPEPHGDVNVGGQSGDTVENRCLSAEQVPIDARLLERRCGVREQISDGRTHERRDRAVREAWSDRANHARGHWGWDSPGGRVVRGLAVPARRSRRPATRRGETCRPSRRASMRRRWPNPVRQNRAPHADPPGHCTLDAFIGHVLHALAGPRDSMLSPRILEPALPTAITHEMARLQNRNRRKGACARAPVRSGQDRSDGPMADSRGAQATNESRLKAPARA